MTYLHTIQSKHKKNQAFKVFYSKDEDKIEIHFLRDNEEPVIIELDPIEMAGLNFNNIFQMFYFRKQDI